MRSLVVAAAAVAALSLANGATDRGAWSIELTVAPESLTVSLENRGEAEVRGTGAMFAVYRGQDLVAWAMAPALRYEPIDLDPGDRTTRTVRWSELSFSGPRGEPIAPAGIEQAMADGRWSIGLVLSDDRLTVWSNRQKLAEPGDRAALQGEWGTGGRKLVFEGDRFSVGGGSGAGAFSIDESTDPKQIDFGDGASAIKGIYEIDGDLLRMSVAAPGTDRPTQFEAAHTVVRRRS
jgi:hypothetical protein